MCWCVWLCVCQWWGREIVLMWHVVLRCGYAWGCLLLLSDKLESWSIWDYRFSICLHWAMAFSSLNLTWLSASSSLLWPCLSQFRGPCDVAWLNFVWYIPCWFYVPLPILLLSLISKVEEGCWGWLLGAVIWLAWVIVWTSNCWLLVVKRWTTTGGLACADCIILLTLLMAVCSSFWLMLGSALRSWTIVSSKLSPGDLGILIVVSIIRLRGCWSWECLYQLQYYCRPLPF